MSKSSRNPITTTPYQIMDYWSDKRFPNGNMVVIDMGEKVCMACGAFYSDYPTWKESFVKPQKNKDLSLERYWNTSVGLQRCHIIADAAGGEDKPENLLLLCSYCHDTMPKINDRDIVLVWVSGESKRAIEEAHRGVVRALDICNVPENIRVLLMSLSGNDHFHDAINKYSKETQHFPQLGIGFTRESLWFDDMVNTWSYYKDHDQIVREHYKNRNMLDFLLKSTHKGVK